MSEHGIVERAEQFIWLNARLLERQLFDHLFRGGPRESSLAALRAYQNADGGFGNALEPDKRCPTSQPIDVEIAMKRLLVGQRTVVRHLHHVVVHLRQHLRDPTWQIERASRRYSQCNSHRRPTKRPEEPHHLHECLRGGHRHLCL